MAQKYDTDILSYVMGDIVLTAKLQYLSENAKDYSYKVQKGEAFQSASPRIMVLLHSNRNRSGLRLTVIGCRP